jgi:hypothetical protein
MGGAERVPQLSTADRRALDHHAVHPLLLFLRELLWCARARALHPEAGHYDICLRAYQGQAVDPAQIPTDLRSLVADAYFDPRFFDESAFGRLMAANQAYRWVIRTPVRNHYGERDEVISIGLGRLAMEFQRAIGNDKVEAISTGPTSHRGTFARAVPDWKAWFDTLAAG